jgi:hypothetical protein
MILGSELGDDVLGSILKISPKRMSYVLGDLVDSKKTDLGVRIEIWAQHIRENLVDAHRGHELCREFLDLILMSPPFSFPADFIKHFRATFKNSDRVSIDSFITEQREDELGEIAKIAVAAFILLCEREGRLGGDWYQVLNEALLRNIGNLDNVGLRVITFNYDRSLQRYLNRTFQTHFIKNEIALEKLQLVETHHVYGSLGNFDHVDYGARDILKAAEGIHLATNRTKAETELIGEWLAQADRVIFLGFGFWEENVQLLRLRDVVEYRKETNLKPQERLSSGFRLPKYIVADMRAQHGVRFGVSEANAYDFVMNTAVFSWKVSIPKELDQPPAPGPHFPRSFIWDW